jgi:hypothetical protein
MPLQTIMRHCKPKFGVCQGIYALFYGFGA